MKAWISSSAGGGLVASPLISALDHGFTVGDGVFETVKISNGKAVLLERHLLRLQNSSAKMQMQIPGFDDLKTACLEVLLQPEVSKVKLGRLRITVSSGPSELGSNRGNDWTLVIVFAPSSAWPESAKVIISDVMRNELSPLAGAKTTSYAENVLALKKAHDQNASEAILLNLVGNVAEGTGSNIFMVKNGTVLTPPETDGILAGITRNAVIESIPENIRFSELSFTKAELLNADEVFLTSSTRDIQPVTQIDNKIFPIGPITLELMKTFDEWLDKNYE